jgi:hypothetical protein
VDHRQVQQVHWEPSPLTLLRFELPARSGRRAPGPKLQSKDRTHVQAGGGPLKLVVEAIPAAVLRGEPVLPIVPDATSADGATVGELLGQLGYPVTVAEAAQRLGRAGERVRVAELAGEVAGLVAIAFQQQLPRARPMAMITRWLYSARFDGGASAGA